MEIDKLLRIKSLGNLLQYYHSDLTYILNFQRCKQKAISRSKYRLKPPGSFQSFLNEFKIARCVEKAKVSKLLDLTMEWVSTNQADEVDSFADKLRKKGLTHGKTMTSLASKVLFLNNPSVILPCDALNRGAVGVKINRYSDFDTAIRDMRETLSIDDSLVPVQGYLCAIENDFKGEIDHISKIRQNRFLDKLLWVQGLALKNRNNDNF
jgi:hypothetical protein